MSVHGVTRGTRDLDLLAVAPECLVAATWTSFETHGITVEVRRGGVDDPLAGVTRFSGAGMEPLDLVVGRDSWQAAMLERAREAPIDGTVVPVVTATDLILLKLYAGGSQDAWDVEQLLTAGNRAALTADVERALVALPPSCRGLWQRIGGTKRSTD